MQAKRNSIEEDQQLMIKSENEEKDNQRYQILEFIIIIMICIMLIVFFFFINQQNFIMNILSSVLVVLLIYFKYLAHVRIKLKASSARNSQESQKSSKENDSSKQQFLKAVSVVAYKNLDYVQLGIITLLYITFFEQVISSIQQKPQIIVISYFLSHFTSITYIRKNNNNLKRQITILIQQLYTIIRLQVFVEFDLFNLFLNLLYLIYSATCRISKPKKIVIEQQLNQYQPSKKDLAMHLYQSILQIIPEGLAVINSEKRLLYANPTLKRILESNKKSEIQKILMNLGKINNFPPEEKQNSNTNQQGQDIKQQQVQNNNSAINLTQGQIKCEGVSIQSEKKLRQSRSQSARNLSQHQISLEKSQNLNKNENSQSQISNPQQNNVNCEYPPLQKIQQLKESDSIKKRLFLSNQKPNHIGSKDKIEECKENDSQLKFTQCMKSNYSASKEQTRTIYSQQSSKAPQHTSKPESKVVDH